MQEFEKGKRKQRAGSLKKKYKMEMTGNSREK